MEELIFEPRRCNLDSSNPYTLEELIYLNTELIGRPHRHPTVKNICERLINAQVDVRNMKKRQMNTPEAAIDLPPFLRVPSPILKKHKTFLDLPNVQYLQHSHGIEDEYNNLEIIGQGAFGTVYKGRSGDGSLVAIKEMDIGGLDSEKIFAIKKELRVLNEASEYCGNHVNKLYDVLFDSKKEKIYLILEFLDGIEMFKYFKGKKMFFKDDYYAMLSEQLIDGFVCLHEAGIAHRDIKLENMMLVDGNRRAVIIDFGLSCLKECHVEIVGTPVTIAPEAFFDQMDYSNVEDWKRADMWSLGCSLYEMIMGKEYPMQTMFIEYFQNGNANNYLKILTNPQDYSNLDLQSNFFWDKYPKMYQILNRMLVLDPFQRSLSSNSSLSSSYSASP
jgi:serine/threonine protein kinase